MTGRSFGVYHVVAKVGEGGMGEVYRAHDSRLGRDVAIKTSKQVFDDRFTREARAIAALNHPNVCTLYDVGPDYLVMEYVEGLSLADCIAQGPLPEAEALAVAMQIATALEAAHEKGIVHRDLKPANIRIKPDGQVKVLDFGLAKVVAGVGPATGNPDNSPTFTGHLATEMGVILGTAAYMAPEQARSQAVDKRADIWAFGVVLWEMLTGRRPFPGDTASDALASVLKDEPPWAEVSPRVRPLLRRCLEKDPRKRLHDIADARLWLEEPPQAALPVAASRSPKRGWLLLAVSVACLAAASALVLWGRRGPVSDERSIQFSIVAPAGAAMDGALSPAAISPDERSVVFMASTAAADTGLYVRSLETGATRFLPGTDHGTEPFWAPDGRSVAFIAGGRLRQIQLAGGPPRDMGEAATNMPGDWAPGVILLGLPGGIWQIPESGGTRKQLTKFDPDRGETIHTAPQFLPDGRHFLYYIVTSDPRTRGIYLGSLDGANERQLVVATAHKGRYVPARRDQPAALLFVREQALVAQRFDTATGRLIGEPSTVVEPISRGAGDNSDAAFWAGPMGMIAFRGAAAENRRLTWFNREGARVEQLPREDRYSSFFLSPDGKKAAVDVMNMNSAHDIWIYEFGRNTMTRQTSDPANDFLGVWSPDGKRLAFGSSRTGSAQMYLTTAGGSAPEQQITDGTIRKYPLQWTRDGKYVLYRGTNPETAKDELWALEVDGDRKPFLVLRTSGSQFTGQISPDGRWLAYQSTLSGTNEVYAQRFPVATSRVLLSNKGGRWPKWRSDGRELYFVSSNDILTAVSVDSAADDLRPDAPKELFRAVFFGNLTYTYDVAEDGNRFLIVERTGEQDMRLDVMTNWRARMK
jgi:Tol biopolymer transport system component/predicted Ser/Thr protein kinase